VATISLMVILQATISLMYIREAILNMAKQAGCWTLAQI
jgi:hypothetical protein